MRIITPRQHHREVSYALFYEYTHLPGAGFSFPCNEKGEIDESKLHPNAKESLRLCREGHITTEEGDRNWDGDLVGPSKKVNRQISSKGVQKREHSWMEPAVGECSCGEEVVLHGFTNTCEKCGRDYNGSGQLLAPRSQWGEETGESLSDILSIDGSSTESLFD